MVVIQGRVEKGEAPDGKHGTWGKLAGALWDLGWGAAKYLAKHPELYTPAPVVRKSAQPMVGSYESQGVTTRQTQYSVPAFSDTPKPVTQVNSRRVEASVKTHESMRQRQADKLYGARPKINLGQNPKVMNSLGNTPNQRFDPWVGRADWGPVKTHWPRLYSGEPLNDNDVKQLWHDVDLVRYGVNDRMARMKAEALQQYAEQQLAKQVVLQAPKTDAGEVILWGTPVRAQDALGHALQDVRYFREHDRHLGPGQVVASGLNKGVTQPASKEYPIIPPKNFHVTQGYPDITEKYLEKLRRITQETADTFNASGKVGVYHLFSKNFPNNGKWDLQVGHGLPSQVIVRDQNTGHVKYNPLRKGEALTHDQYATFRGKVVRAGYLSNYTFGQAIAAGELFDFEGVTAAQAFSILSNLKNIDLSNITASLDNPEDIKAILEGYRDYRNEHPKKFPTPGSYRNK